MIRAGSAQIDITPPLGTHLAGDGAGIRRPGLKVLDPLHARAVVLESNSRRLAILGLDVLCMTDGHTRSIREAAQKLGFDPEAVLVYALQNHSAPSVGRIMLDPDFPFPIEPETEYVTGSEESYCRQAVQGSIAALQKAVRKLSPVAMAYGRGALSGQAFNRRASAWTGPFICPGFIKDNNSPWARFICAIWEDRTIRRWA